jgi:hypothetical protein
MDGMKRKQFSEEQIIGILKKADAARRVAQPHPPRLPGKPGLYL